MAAELVTTTGILLKWTNYVHGWQPRYFILKNGILMYHKSEQESSFGCRGAIAVKASTFALNEFDCCRFDVGVCDYVWYLRAKTREERDKWILALEEQTRAFDKERTNNGLPHDGSSNNITDSSLDESSTSSNNHVDHRNDQRADSLVRNNRSQETLPSDRDRIYPINPSQTLNPHQDQQHLQYSDNFCDAQEHFEDPIIDLDDINNPEQASNLNDHDYHNERHHRHPASDKPITQNAISASDYVKPNELPSLVADGGDKNRLSHSGVMGQIKHCNGKEIQSYHGSTDTTIKDPVSNIDDEAFIEGTNYSQGFSANREIGTEARDIKLSNEHTMTSNNNGDQNLAGNELAKSMDRQLAIPDHPLWPKIDQLTKDQLYHAQIGLGPEGSTDGWQLFAEDGQMRLYTRELEIDGLVCDPLKAVHNVRGITGFEMCHRFFSPTVRFEWEQTLESMNVIDTINQDTLLFHQVHKRIWPAAQRDAVFWSHIRQIESPSWSNLSRDDINPGTRPDLKLHSVWIVNNNSVERPDIPLNGCVRLRLTVSLVCETYIPVSRDAKTVRREDLVCKIIYISTINPGGWAPASMLRAIYKKEYPKFLDNFSKYVIASTKSKPIVFE